MRRTLQFLKSRCPQKFDGAMGREYIRLHNEGRL